MIWKVTVVFAIISSVLAAEINGFAQVGDPARALPECNLDTVKVQIRTALIVRDSGLFVRGITHDKFRAASGKEVYGVQCFSQPDEPFTVGIVIDYSSSAYSQAITLFLDGIRAFKKAANEHNKYFGVGFRSEPFVMLEPTSESSDFDNFLMEASKVNRSGQTGLNDALELALTKFPEDKRQRRVLLVASDGGENFSKNSSSKSITDRLRKAGINVYVYKFDNTNGGTRVLNPSDVDADMRILRLTSGTGGGGGSYSKSQPLDVYFGRLSKRLREEYTIGFTPARAENKWRRLSIEVKVPTDFPAIKSTGGQWFFY